MRPKKIIVIFSAIMIILLNQHISAVNKKDGGQQKEFDINDFKIKNETVLKADGDGGIDTYELIKRKFGPDSIEAPDVFPSNHTGFKHIKEGTDNIAGNYFVFYIHKDKDKDREFELDKINKQRNEIKTYDKSNDDLKCFRNEAAVYQWKFFINKDMSISKKFSHFFQIKAVGGDDQQPIITLTGFISGSNEYFEIRHNASSNVKFTVLDRTGWKDIKGRWLYAECIIYSEDSGYINLTVRSLDGTKTYLSAEIKNIDMWRKGASFNRPKWGIYRGLDDKDNLKSDEETVFFADFTIKKLIKIKN